MELGSRLSSLLSNHDHRLDRRTLGHGGLYLTDHIFIVDTDDGLHRGTGVAIHDVVLGQHVGGGDDDGTNLVQGQHDHPPLVAALQDQHDGVVLADAQGHQVRGGLVGLLLQLRKGGANLLALVVGPQQGQSVGLLLRPDIHHVVGEVEVLWDDELQMLIVILYRLKVRLL